MSRPNPARRAQLTDAAIGLLARDGTHGLTHRAVERAAGLPAGTAVNYFRSREGLLVAVAERVVSLHLQDMQRIDRQLDAGVASHPLADLLEASLMEAATAERERYLAIFELRMEARRRPALAAALARLDSVATVFTADEHAALGLGVPPEAVPTLMTLYGGALFVLVTGSGDVRAETVRRIAQAIAYVALN